MLPGGMPVVAQQGGSAIDIIRRLNLTSLLCLDAGDAASLPAASATWNDLSGEGHHFNLGATSGAEASDPAIVGTAGQLSSGNYLLHDGGDYCTMASANPAWVQSMHQAAALFWAAFWINPASVSGSGVNPMFGTNGGTATAGTGVHFMLDDVTTPGRLAFRCVNAGSNQKNVNSGALAASVDTWNFAALAVDESAGAGGGVFFLNGSSVTFNSAYASPSTGDASRTMQLGARGNANSPLPNGGRLGMAIMGTGSIPSVAQLQALFDATRGRFGV